MFTFVFCPQFIPRGYPLPPTAALLGLLQVSIEIVFYLSFAAVIGRARTRFTRGSVRRSFDALCGNVLLGLGVRVAAESQ